jgi:hypothetical protein
MRRVLGVAVLAVVASGCLSHGMKQTASTMGKGNVAGGVELDVDGIVFTGLGGGNLFYPKFNGHVRFGLTDKLDLGVRAGSTLLEVQGKYMFTSPDSEFLVVSLSPALSGYFFTLGGTSAGAINIPITGLIGLKLGDHELVFGPRLTNQIVFLNLAGMGNVTGYVLSLGLSVGFALRLADFFMLIPEIAFTYPTVATLAASAGNMGGVGSVAGLNTFYVSFGLGATFGKFKPVKGAPKPALPPEEYENIPPPPPPPPPTEVPPPPPPPAG